MKYGEAIDLLDLPAEGKEYGKGKAKSLSQDLWLIKGKYGLYYCTRDWPAPHTPTFKNLEATDWIIEND